MRSMGRSDNSWRQRYSSAWVSRLCFSSFSRFSGLSFSCGFILSRLLSWFCFRFVLSRFSCSCWYSGWFIFNRFVLSWLFCWLDFSWLVLCRLDWSVNRSLIFLRLIFSNFNSSSSRRSSSGGSRFGFSCRFIFNCLNSLNFCSRSSSSTRCWVNSCWLRVRMRNNCRSMWLCLFGFRGWFSFNCGLDFS